MIEKITGILKGAVPAILSALALFFGWWVSTVFKQKQRNTIDEIDLSARKISLDTHAKPLDDLVAESNKSHGASSVVNPTRNDPKKG